MIYNSTGKLNKSKSAAAHKSTRTKTRSRARRSQLSLMDSSKRSLNKTELSTILYLMIFTGTKIEHHRIISDTGMLSDLAELSTKNDEFNNKAVFFYRNSRLSSAHK